eukprot:gene22232-biopygen20719
MIRKCSTTARGAGFLPTRPDLPENPDPPVRARERGRLSRAPVTRAGGWLDMVQKPHCRKMTFPGGADAALAEAADAAAVGAVDAAAEGPAGAAGPDVSTPTATCRRMAPWWHPRNPSARFRLRMEETTSVHGNVLWSRAGWGHPGAKSRHLDTKKNGIQVRWHPIRVGYALARARIRMEETKSPNKAVVRQMFRGPGLAGATRAPKAAIWTSKERCPVLSPPGSDMAPWGHPGMTISEILTDFDRRRNPIQTSPRPTAPNGGNATDLSPNCPKKRYLGPIQSGGAKVLSNVLAMDAAEPPVVKARFAGGMCGRGGCYAERCPPPSAISDPDGVSTDLDTAFLASKWRPLASGWPRPALGHITFAL